MALPTFTIACREDLHLLALLTDRHHIDLASIDAVRRAPLYLSAVKDKVKLGWICPTLPQVRLIMRFSKHLACLDNNILPRLSHDPNDATALRDLRKCGNGMQSVRRRAAGQLVDLTVPFSSSLTAAARQALNPKRKYKVTATWVEQVQGLVTRCRSSAIVPAIRVTAATALPIFVLSNLHDLELMSSIFKPLNINLAAITDIRRAPLFLAAIQQKEASGWICARLPLLRRVTRLAELLADLADDILVRLADDADDRQALQDLRTCGNAMRRLRRNAAGLVGDLVGSFSNCLTRVARKALDQHRGVSSEWLEGTNARVVELRSSSITF